jgi:nicotinate-nucleotide pyrophosphorylase (carboxylating)
MENFVIDKIIKNALNEDIGTGDITTLSTVAPEELISGDFIAKEDGVICGLDIVKRVYEIMDETIVLVCYFKDGNEVKKGDVIAKVGGNAQKILTGERVALNFLQRLSGIAGASRKASELIKGTKTVIADTRKTTPGLRVLEKYAVKTGGGSNHRYNLSDGVLIKDNHIKASGGISKAIEKARAYIPHTLKIEVEVENFEQIKEALKAGADIIMLDNMSIDQMAEAVKLIDGKALTEASGNMGEKDLLKVAETGVDIISIGALTHTVKAMDISLKFVDREKKND